MKSKKVGDEMVVSKGVFLPRQSLFIDKLQDAGATNRLTCLLFCFPTF